MTVRLHRVPMSEVPFRELDRRPDRTIYQTRPWLDFLASSQHAEPVLAEVRDGTTPLGWFTGAIVRRYGLKVLGSPLPGWTTSYMGFNLDDPDRRTAAMEALARYAFDRLGCVHLEVMDREFTAASPPEGFRAGKLPGYELDLMVDDEALLAGMTEHGRRDVRRALRNGVTIEEVDPLAEPGFADEYYSQVCESFAKRSLSPPYPRERIECVIRHLHPTGRLILLRARTPDGTPAATGIFPGQPGAAAVFWMGASRQDLQHLLPNEALMWSALRLWRDRGAVRFDFGGGGRYKAKYGGTEISVPWLRASKYSLFETARSGARQLARRRQRSYRPLHA